MKSYISLVGELASIRIQNYAGLLASKLAYQPKNWLILTKLANYPISRTDKTQHTKEEEFKIEEEELYIKFD